MTTNEIRETIRSIKPRSAWDKGVCQYAFDLLETIDEGISGGWLDADILEAPKILRKALLNGADNWQDYSYGGCALIYDEDIATRLCTPSELKKTRNGQRNPNKNETWLDVQTRALHQASRMITGAASYNYLHI